MEPLFELKLSVTRFLNHVTIDIRSTDYFVVRGCSVHCRVYGSTSDFYLITKFCLLGDKIILN